MNKKKKFYYKPEFINNFSYLAIAIILMIIVIIMYISNSIFILIPILI